MTINIITFFKTILLVQLFFSFAITMTAYAIPDNQKDYVTSFSDITGEINLTSVSSQVSEGLQKQTSIPVLELGAMIFYSGNILLDLLLNFVFAIPEMIGLLIYGFTRLFSIDPQIIYIVESFAGVAVLVLYFISLIQLLTGLRSGRVVS